MQIGGIMMRTAVNLPDDDYEAAHQVAAANRISLGDAVAQLTRNGLRRPPGIQAREAFPCFAVRDDAPPIGLEATLQEEDLIA